MRVTLLALASLLFVAVLTAPAYGDAVTISGLFNPSLGELSTVVRYSTTSGVVGAHFDALMNPNGFVYQPFLVLQFPINLAEIVTLIPYVGAAPFVTPMGSADDTFGLKLGQSVFVTSFGLSVEFLIALPSMTSNFTTGFALRF